MAWMGMPKAYSSISKSRAAGGLFSLSQMPGKITMSSVGGYAFMGVVSAAMSYDPTQRNVASHAAQEGLKVGADLALDTAVFGTIGAMGMVGAGVAMGGVIGLSMLGLSPGETVGKMLENAGEAYNKQVNKQPTPIKQNQRTMASIQRSMKLLGQTGRGNSMLGQEASFMHN